MPGQDIPPKLADAALYWGAQGFFVFRCAPNAKEPLGGSGYKDATNDPAVIEKWWSETPNANIGASPERSGMFVLDVDPPRGEETLAALELDHGVLPTTLTIRTPRGGTHYWLKGSCRSSAGTETNGLGPNLDTRGQGGYVLLPPSRVVDSRKKIDGNYTVEIREETADSPSWIDEAFGRQAQPLESSGVGLDVPANIERAARLLRQRVDSADVAVEGHGGDDRTYRMACKILDLGLSPAVAEDLLWRIWNPACKPPWLREELQRKVANAAEYCQNDMGAWAVAPPAKTFSFLAGTAERHRFYPYELTDETAFQPPEWLIPDLIPKRGTVQITGPQKSFKTFLTTYIALNLSLGNEIFGYKKEPIPVVYVAGENASALVLKHCPAIGKNTFPSFFRVVKNMPLAADPSEVLAFIEEAKKAGFYGGLVVIDTATRALRGLDENSAKDMGIFSAACDTIQRALDCTVLIIRHTGKDKTRGGRGSNVLDGDFDTILDIERHEKSMFAKMCVHEQRNAAEREKPYYFRMEPAGDSLAPREIGEADFVRGTQKNDPLSRARIGAVLLDLGAVTKERAVSTHVLALTLAGAQEDSPKNVGLLEKRLRALATDTLQAYAVLENKNLTWFAAGPALPAQPAPPPSPA